MITHIAKAGRSFKGVMTYLLHDPNTTESNERVDWTVNENMVTECPHRGWKVMAYTAMTQDQLKLASGMSKAGRITEKPVLHYSLSWHPNQYPDKDEMLEAARRSIAALDLQEHEAIIVAHRDTPHKHCHVVINRIHPVTGRVANQSHSKRKLSKFAHQLELEGGKIYCYQRKENFEMQQQTQKPTQYGDPVIRDAWEQSRNGREFIQHLSREGYYLCRGRKRIVVVDPHGKAHNPTRHLDGVRAKEFNRKLADIDYDSLPDANDIAPQIAEHKDGQKSQEASYAQLATERLNAMADRHHEEQSSLLHRHAARKRSEQTKLDEFYQLDEQEQRIAELETKTQNPSWWRKMTGGAKRDRKQLYELRLSHESASKRYDERIDHLDQERTREIAALRSRQAEERSDLVKLIAERKPLRQPPVIDYNYGVNREQSNHHAHARSAPSLRI